MAINKPDLFMEGIWDWSFLNECFGHGIKASDIDGVVERKGNFLWLETKKPGTEIPNGQRKLYKQLVLRGDFVLFIFGNKNMPEYQRLWMKDKDGSPKLFPECPTNSKKIKEFVCNWYNWANDNPTLAYLEGYK